MASGLCWSDDTPGFVGPAASSGFRLKYDDDVGGKAMPEGVGVAVGNNDGVASGPTFIAAAAGVWW